ncbi:MAG: hypothetical protein M1374_04175 [Firmicutes bacterium]|nr:hypothetical protein [Bacillota bacterium]
MHKSKMRINTVLGVSVAIVGLGAGLAMGNGGNSPSVTGPVARAHLVEAVISNAPSTCGSWATSPTDPTDAAITDRYGTILSCQLLGYTWVMITAGITNPAPAIPDTPAPPGAAWTQNGVFGTYTCAPADNVCLSSASDHLEAGWTFTPYAQGWLKVMAIPSPTVLLFEAGNKGEFLFNTITNSIVPWSSSSATALEQCWKSWDAGLSAQNIVPSNATPEVDQAFEHAHPQCATPGNIFSSSATPAENS